MILFKTFEVQQFFEATEEVAKLVPEIGSLFPYGRPRDLKKGGITESVLLLKFVAEDVLDGKVNCQLHLCPGAASFTNGRFSVSYLGLPARIQATILTHELPASEDPSLDGQAIRNRVAEIRSAALTLGWEDGNP